MRLGGETYVKSSDIQSYSFFIIDLDQVARQHHIYMNSLIGEDDPKRKPTDIELALVLDSLVACRALIIEEGVAASRKNQGDRKVVLNIETGEMERVLSELGGTNWKNALGM